MAGSSGLRRIGSRKRLIASNKICRSVHRQARFRQSLWHAIKTRSHRRALEMRVGRPLESVGIWTPIQPTSQVQENSPPAWSNSFIDAPSSNSPTMRGDGRCSLSRRAIFPLTAAPTPRTSNEASSAVVVFGTEGGVSVPQFHAGDVIQTHFPCIQGIP